MSQPGPASAHTRERNAAALAGLPEEDHEDFADATRGLLASEPSLVLRDAGGRVVWDLESYAFLEAERPAPETVNPALWRLARLNMSHGLFEVVPGIYQVRGYDLSNVTFVEGERGVVVIDPLVSMECAAAALALYRRIRGERPVTGVIYSHSHVDHWGGVKGVVGSTSDLALFHEVGTSRMPPRPFLGPALMLAEEPLGLALGKLAVRVLTPGEKP